MFVTDRLGEAALALSLSGLTHAVLYAGLLAVFAGSLRRGQEPVVARFARSIHGDLPADVAAYTRAATVAWCMFCAGQLTTSAILFMMARREVWSLFVNVLDLPLLATMFAAEYAWRRLRLPDRSHIGFVATIRIFARRSAVMSRGG